ncbi:MAG: 4Fe-4S dicluster domain-containing protein [Deltaproteobacteria bacterium]|nr:4Fe-4S dicluster domain-containing protein [Deltaproteobacteria bacterium]
MPQMGIFFDQTRCTGCHTCAVACKDWHDIDAGPASLMRLIGIERGTYPNLFAAYLASPCYQCETPPCIQACPEDAIAKREADGIVVVDREKCVGAGECPQKCLKACPWDAPQFGPEPDARMQKCDLCLERLDQGQQTICVEACPMFALDVGPVDELREKYGDQAEAEGFKSLKRFAPSAVFKAKKQTAC